MVPKSRFSIALLMMIVCFIAIDIALVQAAYGHAVLGRSAGYLAIVLPMANLLLLSLPKLKRSHPGRSFWIGFEVVGWGVIAILGYMDEYAKEILFISYEWIRSFQLYPPESAPDLAMIYTFFVVFHTPPQLLLAWLGGRVSAGLARFRVVIATRSPREESGQ
jgi:hypothetical protein